MGIKQEGVDILEAFCGPRDPDGETTVRGIFGNEVGTSVRTFNFDLPSDKKVAENKKEEQKASV